MNENGNKMSIFLLVVSVLTLISVTLGATFAFFTTFINRDDAVDVGAANFKLSLDATPLYDDKKIIPTNDDDIITALNNQCIDKNEYGACYAFNIKMTSEGMDQDVLGKIKITDNGIPNLKYMILDADNLDENNEYVVYKSSDYANEEYESIGEAIHLETGKSRNFILVVWLSNLNTSQDDEAGKHFRCFMSINSSMGATITGSIDANLE